MTLDQNNIFNKFILLKHFAYLIERRVPSPQRIIVSFHKIKRQNWNTLTLWKFQIETERGVGELLVFLRRKNLRIAAQEQLSKNAVRPVSTLLYCCWEGWVVLSCCCWFRRTITERSCNLSNGNPNYYSVIIIRRRGEENGTADLHRRIWFRPKWPWFWLIFVPWFYDKKLLSTFLRFYVGSVLVIF